MEHRWRLTRWWSWPGRAISRPADYTVKSQASKRAVKIIIIVVVVFLVLWLATELLIPPIASKYIKREISKRYPQAGEVSVSVGAFPAIKLAFKQYNNLEIEAEHITIEGILFDSIKLSSDRWPDATYRATIGPEEIDRFFSDTGSFLVNPKAGIQGDALHLSGRVQVGSVVADVTATGTLRMDGQRVFFVPLTIDVSGVKTPQKAIDQVSETMSQASVFTIREDVPFTVSQILVRNGKLVIDGAVNLEEALDFKL